MSKSLIILAGGKSTRMHTNKEMLMKDGRYIIKNNIRLYEQYFDDIVVVTNHPEFYHDEYVNCVSDVYLDKGPLAGIHSGLQKIKNECAYVVACDMPYFDHNYMEYIYSLKNDNDIVVSKYEGYFEPFHAIYDRKLVNYIENLLVNDNLAINNLFKSTKTKVVNYNNTSFIQNIFVNMNYKKDYLDYVNRKGFDNIVETKRSFKV